MSRTNNSIRNAFWGYISKLTNIIMPFIFRTILIYKLGSEYIGLDSLFTSILQVLNLSELGFGTAMVYNMYKPIAEHNVKKVNALLNYYKKVYRYIGSIILFIGLVIIPFLPKIVTGSYPSDVNLYVVYLAFLINTVVSYWLYSYRVSIFNASQRNDIASKILMWISIFKYFISIIVIILLENYYYYLLVLIIFTIINNLFNLYVSKKYYPEYKCEGEISKEEHKTIRKNVSALMCHKVGSTILNSSDNIIISMFLGLNFVTLYTNYYYVIVGIEGLIMIMFNNITSSVGNSIIEKTKEENTQVFKNILFINFFIVCISSTILICIFQDFIKLWVGEEYILSNTMMFMFILYFFFHCIRRTIIMFRDASGMWWDNKFQPIVSSFVNIVLNVLLVNLIGIYGIIISTLISMIFIDIPWESKVFCTREVNVPFKEYIIELIKYLFITLIISFIAYYICYFIRFNNLFITIILKFAISGTISMIALHILLRKKESYKYLINLMKMFFKKGEFK